MLGVDLLIESCKTRHDYFDSGTRIKSRGWVKEGGCGSESN